MNRPDVSLFALASLLCAPSVHAATSREGFAALLDGVVFFGGMLVLVVIAAALRIRDARAGLTPEEKKARLQRRLPWVMGAFFGLVFYILFRTM